MAKVYETITERLREFIAAQRMFFIATAPLSTDGLVNLSPKGLSNTFTIVDDQTVAYLDLTGSGVETIAHLRENGRVCVMFCAFEGRPRIVRIHGQGEVLEPTHPEFNELRPCFGDYQGVRSIIRIRAKRISDSCGYGVPMYEHKGERDQLQRWAETKGEEGVEEYQADNNAKSLDGLPGLEG